MAIRESQRRAPFVGALLAAALLAPALARGIETAPTIPPPHKAARTGALETWRAVEEEGRAAINVKALPGRIERCEAFLAAHPNFEDRKPVLEALADAYLDSGAFDPSRVAQIFEQIAALDPDSYWAPAGLVERYYLEHALPLASAQRLLAMTRERLPAARAKLTDIEEKDQRKSRELILRHREIELDELDATLRLVLADNASALAPLERALAAFDAIPHGILVRAHGVAAPTGDFNAGYFGSTRLSLALAYLRTGRKDLASAQYRRIVATFADHRRKAWDDEVRKGLGLAPRAGTTVTADPVAAADFKLKDLDGKEVRLSSFRGKVVILDFWATWCHWCLVEMPLLTKFQEAHPKDVVLLTISTDRFEDRVNIKPTLERRNLHPIVLLEDPEQLASYQYSALPSLYVIDPGGKVAMTKTGYDPETREKLTAIVDGMLNGKPTPGRPLLTIATAPPGFGLRWKRPIAGRAQAIEIGGATAQEPGEVAAIGPQGLTRWTATGALLGRKAVEGSWLRDVEATDLDGNGTREWVVFDYSTVHVLDTEGVPYWDRAMSPPVEFVRFAPAGDGATQEVIVKAGNTVAAIGVNSDILWQTDRIPDLETVRRDGGEGVIYQAGDALKGLDARGRPSRDEGAVPAGYTFAGRLAVGGGWLDFFSGPWDPAPELSCDLEGDGAQGIVIAEHHAVRVFKPDGTLVLVVDTGEETIEATATGNLDGKPGDELAILIAKYGLVVLGR